jgi:sigma-B regulation protein RsbU (phosphoserine phosphatase)
VEHSLRMQPGDRLFMYSDGLFEEMNSARVPFGKERLRLALCAPGSRSLRARLESAWRQVERWNPDAPPHDDCSLLALEFVGQVSARTRTHRRDMPGRRPARGHG